MEKTPIGYWQSKSEPQYPIPVANSATEEEIVFMLKMLDKIEKQGHKRFYKGCSTCRLCSQGMGSGEYEYKGYLVPEGLRHYVSDHKVKVPALLELYHKEADKSSAKKTGSAKPTGYKVAYDQGKVAKASQYERISPYTKVKAEAYWYAGYDGIRFEDVGKRAVSKMDKTQQKIKQITADFLQMSEIELKTNWDSWYPAGSGPLGAMQTIVALIEGVAQLKGFDTAKWSRKI